MSDRHLHPVESTVETVKQFDIEQMREDAMEAHYFGRSHQANLVLLEAVKSRAELGHFGEVVVGSYERPARQSEAALRAALWVLNVRYTPLIDHRVEIVPHSELIEEEINGTDRTVLARRFHEVRGRFAGFGVRTTDGLCLVLKQDDELHYYPLYDIESIEERFI